MTAELVELEIDNDAPLEEVHPIPISYEMEWCWRHPIKGLVLILLLRGVDKTKRIELRLPPEEAAEMCRLGFEEAYDAPEYDKTAAAFLRSVAT